MAGRSFKILVTRLSTYEDTAESFTHLLLYRLAAETPGVFPDLAYLPPPKDAAIMSKDKVPWLLGTQTKLGPPAFDVVAFSNSTVLELLNIPPMLRASAVALSRRERLEHEDMPLVILGGANAVSSQLAWLGGASAWVDGVFLGEDPAEIQKLFSLMRDLRSGGAGKPETLSELARRVDGFFDATEPRAVRTAARFISTAASTRGIPVPHFPGRAGHGQIQISEGCAHSCSFCAESWHRKPYTEKPASEILKEALEIKASLGLWRAEVFSFNFNAHKEFAVIAEGLGRLFGRVSLKSQRMDLLAAAPRLFELERSLGKSSFTFGVEGISRRLRKHLGKELDDEALAKCLSLALTRGTRELKIFLIATGHENDADYPELDALAGSVRDLLARAGRGGARVIFSMTPLVRFAWTPLEFEDAPAPETVSRVLSRSRTVVERAGFEFRAAASVHDYAVSQVIARAPDASVSAAASAALDDTGFVFYRSVSAEFFRAFTGHLGSAWPGVLTAGNARPWQALNLGIKEEVIRHRYARPQHL